jgi:hypothetical protein
MDQETIDSLAQQGIYAYKIILGGITDLVQVCDVSGVHRSIKARLKRPPSKIRLRERSGVRRGTNRYRVCVSVGASVHPPCTYFHTFTDGMTQSAFESAF